MEHNLFMTIDRYSSNLTNGEQLTDLSNKEELISSFASHHLQENQLSELGELIKKGRPFIFWDG